MAKKTKIVKTVFYKNLEKVADLYASTYYKLKQRSPLPHRSFRGGHSGTSLIDFMSDVDLLVRRVLKTHEQRLEFYRWVFSRPLRDENGKPYRKGTERWSASIGSKLGNLIPGIYFTQRVTIGSRDSSHVNDDLPRLESIIARYRRLQKDWQQKNGNAVQPDCYQEEPEEHIVETSEPTDALTDVEPIEPIEPIESDGVEALDGKIEYAEEPEPDPFANQQEGL